MKLFFPKLVDSAAHNSPFIYIYIYIVLFLYQYNVICNTS